MKISPEIINAALVAEDIEGHLKLGAPSDEYYSEAKEIAVALNDPASDLSSAEAINSIISRIWAGSFNLSEKEMEFRLPAISRVVQKLIAGI